MQSKPRRLVGGFIDPATLITAGFLLVSLVGGFITTKMAQQSTENRTQAFIQCSCSGESSQCASFTTKDICNSNGPILHCGWSCVYTAPTPTQGYTCGGECVEYSKSCYRDGSGTCPSGTR